MNALQKKLGPLKLWQWLVIGGGTGVAVYLYKKAHAGAAAPEVNPEQEEALLGALSKQAGGGGGGESSGGGGIAAPGPIGLTGEAGAPGVPGAAGAAAEPVNLAPVEQRLGSIAQQLVGNNPPAASHTTAPAAKAASTFTHVNPANGEHYKIVHEKGKTIHLYHSGRKVVVATPKKAKPAPSKRKKPTPIKQRVTVHHAPPARAKPAPAHHAAPPPKRKRR